MSGAACKTVICAAGKLSKFSQKDLRTAFANPVIADAVAADFGYQQEVWLCLETKNMSKRQKDVLKERLSFYAEME